MRSPSERKYQATIVHRRVIVSHASPTRPVISAAIAKAKGTVRPVKPRLSATGCVIIPVSSSRGLSPWPSAGTGCRRANGGAATVITSRKKASTPSMTVRTHG